MTSSSATAFCDAIVFTGEAMVENHALLVREGKIVDIVTQARVPTTDARISCGGQILVPGFVDLQVNGGGGRLLNNSPSADTALHIADAHRRCGTTRLLPTLISDDPSVTIKAVDAVRQARRTDPSVLGIHLEGPHLAKARRGVHAASMVRPFTDEDQNLYRREGDEVLLVTLAPETVSTDVIAALCRKGVLVSLGHTSASGPVVREALRAGASCFTHLFNGMQGMTAREPGPVGVALDDSESWCSVIADGFHVAPELLRLALHAKPRGRVFLVSDAMPPAGSPDPGAFELNGAAIQVEGGRCVTADGTLAGSSITLVEAARYCLGSLGIPIEEVLRLISLYPACFLKHDDRLGKLLPGYEADIVAVTPDLDVEAVWRGGERSK